MSAKYKWLMIASFLCGTVASAQKVNKKKVFRDADAQINVLVSEVKKQTTGLRSFPRSAMNDTLRIVASNDWTSGFFPGILWMLHDYTDKQEWRTIAKEYTDKMFREPYNRASHDVGFKVYNSYGMGYKATGDTSYKRLIIDAAKTLATRFNPKVGAIRSWDFGKWQYPVIIDNMMNLELLFAATRLSGDSAYYKIAVSHANKTLQNHFRTDYSSYHVVDYDTVTGKAIGKGTHQGFSDESAWTRGQGWALYGYTMCYRETGDPAYLTQAENIAQYILRHPSLPPDKVPHWDFNAPGLVEQPRDASAAAVIASALFELSTLANKGSSYRKAAIAITESLANHYRAPIGSNSGYILMHSTGHKPVNSEVDVPLIYADYYFLEALLRSKGKKSIK